MRDSYAWMSRCMRRAMAGFHILDEDQLMCDPEYAARRAAGEIGPPLGNFDPRELVRELKRAWVQAFWFYCKGGGGNAFYPSRIGHVHSSLANGRDLFGEVCEACLESGIEPLGIYECSDARVRADHPEWCHVPPAQLDPANAPPPAERQYGSACIHGGYGDFILEQTREVLSNYPIKAYYLDALGGGDGGGEWLCPVCAEAYQKEFGRPYTGMAALPRAEFYRVLHWKIARSNAFKLKAARLAKELRPDIAFTFNGGLADNCDFATCDIFAHRSGLHRNAALSRRKPAEALLDSIHDDMITPKALDGYRAELWSARSLGVAVCTSFIHPVDGRTPRRQINLIRKVLAEQRRFEPWLRGLEPLAAVGFWFSHDSRKFRSAANAPAIDDTSRHELEARGWVQAAIGAHHPWAYIEDQNFRPDQLAELKVLVLPDVACLSDAHAVAVERFVRRGGALIATGDTSLFDEAGNEREALALSAVFGVRRVGPREPVMRYLDLAGSVFAPREDWVTDLLCCLEGQCSVEPLPGARVAAGVRTVSAATIKTGLGLFNQAPKPSPYPGVVRNRFGRGACWYVAGTPGIEYAVHGMNPFRRLMHRLLNRAAGNSTPVTLEAPDSVELYAHVQPRHPRRLVAGLVNTVWACARATRSARLEEIETMPPVHRVILRFRKRNGTPPKLIYLAPSRKPLRMTVNSDVASVIVENPGVYTMVVAEW